MNTKYIILFFVALSEILIYSCQKQSSVSQYDQLTNDIVEMNGEFVYDSTLNDYSFNQKYELEELLQEFEDQDSLVDFIVSHLTHERVANSFYKGNKVIVGNLYYQALTQLVYYEPKDQNGDLSSNWGGYIPVYSGIDKLRLAQQKWKEVIDKETYIFL